MSSVFCRIRMVSCLFLLMFLGSMPALSQQLSFADTSVSTSGSVVPPQTLEVPEASNHRFWDCENRALFSAVAASSAADFGATYANLSNGGRELNPITRLFSGSTAGLVVNFAGETAGVIGISYYLHKAGHHKLERMVSVVNISASTAAVMYDIGKR